MNQIDEYYQRAKALRKKLPIGACLRLIYMQNERIPEGTIGTIEYIDDDGQIYVRWEAGSVPLQVERDQFEVLVCGRCGQLVFRTMVDGYPFQCKEHYEDLYTIETVGVSIEKLLPRTIATMTSKEVQAMSASDIREISYSQCRLCKNDVCCDTTSIKDCRNKIFNCLLGVEADE